ncbi:GumC family protein [Hoeflea sp.]|uniref:GumC family protein n=1 Tax=Hoeflea sp. TaxID=1940281 RepID=UPI003B01AF0C
MVRKPAAFDPGESVHEDKTGDGCEDTVGVSKPENSSPVDRQALIDRIRAAAGSMSDERRQSTAGDPLHPASGKASPEPAGTAAAGADKSDNESSTGPAGLTATVLRRGLFILFTTILGAALGVMLALSEPRRYKAVSQLVLDPFELRLAGTGLPPQPQSEQAELALVDSHVQIVGSNRILQAVVDDLDLANDPEFNGAANDIGFVGLLRDLIARQGETQAGRNTLALHTLVRNVTVDRDDGTYVVSVSVTAQDPGKSARIANRIADIYLTMQREALSAHFERVSAVLTRRLDVLRQDVEAAERRVEQFKADNDLVDNGEALIGEEQIIRTERQLDQLRARKAELQMRVENAGRTDVETVLSGSSRETLEWPTIGTLRTEFSAAKQTVDTLAVTLGPRHPRRIAAERALDAVRSQIRSELRRIAEANEAELEQIIRSEQQLAARLAGLKRSRARATADLARLGAFERAAAAASARYDSALNRARETREQRNFKISNTRVISEATPPIESVGPSRIMITAGGLLLGFIAGLAIVVIIGALRISLSGLQRSAGHGHDPAPPSAGEGLTGQESPQPNPEMAEPAAPASQPPDLQETHIAQQPERTDWTQRPIVEPEHAVREDDAVAVRQNDIKVRRAAQQMRKAREEARGHGS